VGCEVILLFEKLSYIIINIHTIIILSKILRQLLCTRKDHLEPLPQLRVGVLKIFEVSIRQLATVYSAGEPWVLITVGNH